MHFSTVKIVAFILLRLSLSRARLPDKRFLEDFMLRFETLRQMVVYLPDFMVAEYRNWMKT